MQPGDSGGGERRYVSAAWGQWWTENGGMDTEIRQRVTGWKPGDSGGGERRYG